MKAFKPEFPEAAGSPQPTGGRALVPLGKTTPLTAEDITKILGNDRVPPEEMGAACAAYRTAVARQKDPNGVTGDILDIHG